MPQTILRCLVALAACVSVASAGPPDNRNAATWYDRVMGHVDAIPDGDLETILNYASDPVGDPSPEVRAALERARPVLGALQRGARSPYSDFNLDYSQGFELALPHLAQLRTAVRIARVESMVQLHDGNAAVAAERLADLYRVSGHFERDRIIISSLVGMAIFSEVDSAVQYGLDRAAFDAGSAADLLNGLETLAPTDPFAMAESVIGEQEIAIGWLSSEFATEDGRADFAERLMMEDVEVFGEMTDEDWSDNVAEYDEVMGAMADAFGDPDRAAGKAMLDEIEKQIEGGAYGPLTTMLLPAITRVHGRMIEAERMLAERISGLEDLARGIVAPEQGLNAAMVYLRAIEKLEAWEAEPLAALRAEDNMDGPGREVLAAQLDEAAEVVDLVREASLIDRCDFSSERSKRHALPLATYLPGMRDLGRMLVADAIRLHRAGDLDGMADRLATGFRVAGHLGGDETLMSAAIAHQSFIETAHLVGANLSRFDETQRSALGLGLNRIARRDPFGYIGAVRNARALLVDDLQRMAVAAGADQEAISGVDEIVDPAPADALLAAMIVLESLAEAAETPFDRLHAVVDVEGWKAAAAMAPHVAPKLARGEYAALLALETQPRVADLRERTLRARRDLRDAFTMVQLEPAAEEDAP